MHVTEFHLNMEIGSKRGKGIQCNQIIKISKVVTFEKRGW